MSTETIPRETSISKLREALTAAQHKLAEQESALASADEDRMLRVLIEPGRDLWVTSPVDLRIELNDLAPETLANVDASTFRIRLDGVDITAGYLAAAAQLGRIKILPYLRAVSMSVPLPRSDGVHPVEVRYQVKTGGGPRFEQSFRVYDRSTVLRQLVKPGKNGLTPAQVDVPAVPPIAPPVFLDPPDKAFITSTKTDLTVSWFDGTVGFIPSALRILLDNTDVTAKFTRSLRSGVWKGATLTSGKHTLVAQVTDAIIFYPR